MQMRPGPVYVGLAFVFSWSWWGWLAWRGVHVTAGSSESHLPGLMGPALAAIVVTAVFKGRKGLGDLLRRCVTIARPGRAAVFIVAPVAVAVATFLWLAAGDTPLPSRAAFLAYPGVPASLRTLPALVIIILLNGFGEEIGWRGWLLEHLAERYGRLRAPLFVGLIWAVWHLPLFWVNQTMADLAGVMLAGWLIGLLLGSYVLAHVYFASGHSILAVALWHVGYNLCVATPATTGLVAATVSTLVMAWGVLVIVGWWRGAGGGQRPKRPERP